MKLRSKAFLIAATLFTSFTAVAQEKVLEINQLPNKAQSFIKDYYQQEKISLVSSDKEFFTGTEYKVIFQDGTEVEFDSKGNWTEVDAKLKAVPQKLIPTPIVNYVNQKFPNNQIVQINKENKEYEIELTSGIDLIFNSKGEFLRIDD